MLHDAEWEDVSHTSAKYGSTGEEVCSFPRKCTSFARRCVRQIACWGRETNALLLPRARATLPIGNKEDVDKLVKERLLAGLQR